MRACQQRVTPGEFRDSRQKIQYQHVLYNVRISLLPENFSFVSYDGKAAVSLYCE